jgi:hypothetical protein
MFQFGKTRSQGTPADSGQGAKSTGSAGYGIDQAIALMRALPVDQNVELVVQVMRHTLESLNVRLAGIIDGAVAKEVSLQERMEKLDGEIESLAEQIDVRRQEIGRLTIELKETSKVKERLLLAQKLEHAEDSPTSISPVPSLPLPTPKLPMRAVR